jgi:hypothetical protein
VARAAPGGRHRAYALGEARFEEDGRDTQGVETQLGMLVRSRHDLQRNLCGVDDAAR